MRKSLRAKFRRQNSPQSADGPPPPGECQVPAVREDDFPGGIQVLHDCDDAEVDICFIHGLSGNRTRTWTAQGQTEPWPKTLLPPKLGKARILTWGYDAYFKRKSGFAEQNGLTNHARHLLTDLTNDRASCGASSRTLILVAHSLGGLVCKEALLISQNNPEAHLQAIFANFKAIAFLGTPHQGSQLADWADKPASVLGIVKSTNKTILDILQTDNQHLRSIQDRFSSMVRQQHSAGRQLEITCFFEELPSPPFGKTIVSSESATFEGYHSISIHADHSHIVKFGSSKDNGFERLLGELKRWSANIASDPSEPVLQISESCRACLQSLAFPDMQSRAHDINAAAVGTCEWLGEHEVYKDWGSSDCGLLWIKGKPGSGKSTLMRDLVGNFLQTSNRREETLILSFFIHGRGSKLQKTQLGLFRSLLHQLLGKVPAALSAIVSTFEERRRGIGEPGEEEGSKWQWHLNELISFFEQSLPEVLTARSLTIFVDALDEAGESSAVDLVDKFKSLLRKFKTSGLKQFRICFTCRHYPILDLDETFQVCVDNENYQDIGSYVRDKLPNSSTSAEILDLISEKANGVFLWAKLVVRQVLELQRNGSGPKEIMDVIISVPQELDALYRNLSCEMNGESLKLIRWVCFATRPLSIEEMKWAMLVDVDVPYRSLQESENMADYPSGHDKMKRRLQMLSRGLVEIVQDGNEKDKSVEGKSIVQSMPQSVKDISVDRFPVERKSIVQFIHQSVKDFFVDQFCVESARTGFNVGTANYRLFRTCIRYFEMEELARLEEIEDGSRWSDSHAGWIEFPFLEYATTFWVAHSQRSEATSIQTGDFMEWFRWPSSTIFSRWLCAHQKLEWGSLPNGTTLLHALSRFGLAALLSIMVNAQLFSTYLDAQDEKGRTPLLWAAWGGKEAAIQLLLDHGAQIDTQDNEGRTPLSRAVCEGYKAAEEGRGAAVQLLLDRGAQIEAQDNEGRTPLSWAAQEVYNTTVQLLLDRGAQIEAQDNEGRTPLSWAAQEGYYKATIQLLLDHGAQIEAQDNEGRTPLSWAAWGGKEAAIQLLLDYGAQIDAQDNEGRTPLFWASQEGHIEATIRLLLDRRAT